MSDSSLKKNPRIIVLAIIGILIFFSFIIYIERSFDEKTSNLIEGTVWIVIGLINFIFWLRTSNHAFIAYMVVCLIFMICYFTDYKGIFIVVPLLTAVGAQIYLLARKRFKWRYHDLLELAAASVDSTENGFTGRPLAAGQLSVTREKLTSFGKLLSKHLIAFPVVNSDRMILLINSSGRPFFRKPDIAHDSFIDIGFDGKVSVNISRKDYQKYKSKLTFDRLCLSLGDLFKSFYEHFSLGKTDEILKTVNSNQA